MSVVIPLYQSEATIGETLASLRAQTWTDWRAVVVDDGSTDRGPELVRAVMRDDPRIEMVHQANRGLAAARNRGLDELDAWDARDESGGRFVHFLDADDWIRPGAYGCLVAALGRGEGAQGVCGGYELRDESGVPVGRPMDPAPMGVALDDLLVQNRIVVHSQMLRRSALAGVRFDESRRVVEDYDLWVRLGERGVRWRSVGEVVASYRLRRGSLSKRSRDMLATVADILTRAHERGAARGDQRCGGERLRDAIRENALNYATMGALMDTPGATDEGIALMREHATGLRVGADALGRAVYWALLFGRCEDPAASGDGVRAPAWTRACAAWCDALEREGFCETRSSRGAGGFRRGVVEGIAREMHSRESVASDLLQGLRSGATIAVVGYGANGRVVAREAARRGIRVVACDDHADRIREGSDDAGRPLVVETRVAIEQRGAWDRVIVTPEREGDLLVRLATMPRLVTWNEARGRLVQRGAPWRDALLAGTGERGRGRGAA